MITAEQIKEIITIYKKYNWSLRSVLLTDKVNQLLKNDFENLFGSAEVHISGIDAAWFSRPSGGDREAWELRHLGMDPVALFETIDVKESQETRKKTLRKMETRLTLISSKKR